ncbi:MAG: DNA adenine methylase [Elusimicrobia bacterium]|nr:DNA adenine methylase [Elusimicrobiota bacterium]
MKTEVFQPSLLYDFHSFPKTRYQGSKLKLLQWISENLKSLNFDSVIDLFGGTGAVSYLFKTQGKIVVYNDNLKFNSIIGKALIENSSTRLTYKDVTKMLTQSSRKKYKTIIQDNFHDIYYTDEENKWLDVVTQNIHSISDPYKKAIAFFALFQACIIKRPYNLFHRKNLYMRTQNVSRSFGNKTTWDKSFEEHFKKFIMEANEAIFDNNMSNTALNMDAMDVPGNYDLVYIDPPYINSSGTGVHYAEFYHFLEGLVEYNNWIGQIDYKIKHRPIKTNKSEWCKADEILFAFNDVFKKFRKSIIVVSYRNDGTPSLSELKELLLKYKKTVEISTSGKYKYALSRNSNTKEILLIGT